MRLQGGLSLGGGGMTKCGAGTGELLQMLPTTAATLSLKKVRCGCWDQLSQVRCK